MTNDIILIDGIRYCRYTPKSEAEFERMIVENAEQIFGEEAIYLDIKKKIANALGEGTIPDGFLFYPEQKRFVMVEVELSSHPVYEHISKQVNKFISAFSNYRSRQKLASMLKEYIEEEPALAKRMKPLLGTKGLYEFLEFDVFEPLAEAKNFEVIVIIEDKTPAVCEALSWLHPSPSLIEAAVYAREGAEMVKALRFEPQYEKAVSKSPDIEVEEPLLSEYGKFAQEKRLEGLPFTEIGKLWKKKKGTTGKLDEKSFLALTDKNGKRIFEWILDFAKEKGYLIRWGTKGFSFNLTTEKGFIGLFFAYSPGSVYKQSIYTGFEELRKKAKNAEVIIKEMRSNLLEMSIFQELSGQNSRENIKCVIDSPIKDDQISSFLNIIEDVAKKIEWK